MILYIYFFFMGMLQLFIIFETSKTYKKASYIFDISKKGISIAGDIPLGSSVLSDIKTKRTCVRCRKGKIVYRKRYYIKLKNKKEKSEKVALEKNSIFFCTSCNYKGIAYTTM